MGESAKRGDKSITSETGRESSSAERTRKSVIDEEDWINIVLSAKNSRLQRRGAWIYKAGRPFLILYFHPRMMEKQIKEKETRQDREVKKLMN